MRAGNPAPKYPTTIPKRGASLLVLYIDFPQEVLILKGAGGGDCPDKLKNTFVTYVTTQSSYLENYKFSPYS